MATIRALAAAWASLLLTVSGCVHRRPPPLPALVAHPHYVLGQAYQARGHWYYPAEAYGLDTTGIAAVQPPRAGLTEDGELPDPGALTASMQTIQLPAIVQVTNLENGRQILVRGERSRAGLARAHHRRLATRRPAAGHAASRGWRGVRVQADALLSRRLTDQLGGGPKLAIATAPSAAITAESLPPPGGGPAGPARALGGAAPEAAGPTVPDRLPERITASYADPGALYLLCGTFGRFTYANEVAARLSGLGADVVRSRDGRQTSYAVRAGPFATIPQADSALDQALRAGVIDARIAVQ